MVNRFDSIRPIIVRLVGVLIHAHIIIHPNVLVIFLLLILLVLPLVMAVFIAIIFAVLAFNASAWSLFTSLIFIAMMNVYFIALFNLLVLLWRFL